MTAPVISAGDLVARLGNTATQLRRMTEFAAFGGDATGVRVKDPSLLLADLDEAAARIQELEAAIATPEAVIANMKRGGIAVPSLRYLIDLHGDEALAKWDRAEAAEARIQALLTLIDEGGSLRLMRAARSALNQNGGEL